MAKADLSAEQLRELLHYDPETGVFTWKVRPSIRVKRVGAVAGNIGAGGYAVINLTKFGSPKKAHRLAWLYIHGKWPEADIDHINGDRLDNRIVNLRDVSRRINTENLRSARRHSKSGLLGAHWHEPFKKWYSVITTDRKRKFLGLFKTPEEAHQAYLAAKRKLHEGCTI
jgi:hypothetical protein